MKTNRHLRFVHEIPILQNRSQKTARVIFSPRIPRTEAFHSPEVYQRPHEIKKTTRFEDSSSLYFSRFHPAARIKVVPSPKVNTGSLTVLNSLNTPVTLVGSNFYFGLNPKCFLHGEQRDSLSAVSPAYAVTK